MMQMHHLHQTRLIPVSHSIGGLRHENKPHSSVRKRPCPNGHNACWLCADPANLGEVNRGLVQHPSDPYTATQLNSDLFSLGGAVGCDGIPPSDGGTGQLVTLVALSRLN